MNFLAMQSVVRQLIGETDSTNTYHPTTEVEEMLNHACVEVADETECLLTFVEFSTNAGDSRFPLPEDFMKTRACEIDISTTLRRQLIWTPFDQFNILVGGNTLLQGQPAYWKVEIGATGVALGTNAPGDIWVYPLCNDNGGDDYTIRLYYHQLPTVLNQDTDASELPSNLHMAICYFAAKEVAEKDSDWGRIRRLDKKYERSIEKFKKTMLKRESRSFVAKNVFRQPGKFRPQGWR